MPIKELEKNITLLRDINEICILKLIKEEGPISRAEVSRRYNISRAAVSDIVARLLQREFIREIGEGNSSDKGGRKPVMLDFNEKAGYVLGVEMKKTSFRVALCDLSSNILSLQQQSFDPESDSESLLQTVYRQIDEMLALSGIYENRLLGIGIGIPGLVDFEQGILREAYSRQPWNGIPLKTLFENRYSTNVYVDNDIKMATIGEFIFGQGRQANNMILIGVGDGIGAGFIINGKLYRGVTFSAGEIGYDELGYFLAEKNEFPLLFHNQHFWGDILSYQNLMRSFHAAIKKGHSSFLQNEVAVLTPLHLLQSALQGDRLCRKLLEEYAALLGILSVNLINYLNPEMVIFNGEIFENDGFILETIKQRVHRDILHSPSTTVEIRSSITKSNSGVKGAVGLLFLDLFEPPVIDTRKYRMAFAR